MKIKIPVLRLFLIIAYLMLAVIPVRAQVHKNAGTTTSPFLRMGIGARAEGMGGAFVALADDANAVYWNPAGLTQLERKELSMTYIQWFQGIRNHFIGFAYPFKKLHSAFGLNVVYLTVSDLEKMSDTGEKQGSIQNFNGLVSMSYAQEFSPTLSLGGNLKIIGEKYDKYSGKSIAIDGGALWLPMDEISMGLCFQNLGPEMKIGGGEGNLPFTIKAGLTVFLLEKNLNVSMQMDKPTDGDTKTSLGAELWVREKVAFRVGYKLLSPREEDYMFTGGIGFLATYTPPREEDWLGDTRRITPKVAEASQSKIALDYAISSHVVFGLMHYLSFGLKF